MKGPPSVPPSNSNNASRNQTRPVLHLLIRFKRQARIGLHVVLTSVRFLCFYRYHGFSLQVSTAFFGQGS